MPKYAKVYDGVVTGYKSTVEPIPPDQIRQIDGLPVLREVVEIRPDYDSTTETLDGPVESIGDTQVAYTWTSRTKTAQELDNEKGAVVDDLDRVLLKICFLQENRIRLLEGKQEITAAQFRNAVKAMI